MRSSIARNTRCLNQLSWRWKSQFVPNHEPANPDDIRRLEEFLEDKPNILVLTGAGISTESGK